MHQRTSAARSAMLAASSSTIIAALCCVIVMPGCQTPGRTAAEGGLVVVQQDLDSVIHDWRRFDLVQSDDMPSRYEIIRADGNVSRPITPTAEITDFHPDALEEFYRAVQTHRYDETQTNRRLGGR